MRGIFAGDDLRVILARDDFEEEDEDKDDDFEEEDEDKDDDFEEENEDEDDDFEEEDVVLLDLLTPA